MERPRIGLLTITAVMTLAAGACLAPAKSPPPIETATAEVDRQVAAVTTIDSWTYFPSIAARLLISEYGVPDEVDSDRLVWNDKGPWHRTVVRNVQPSAVEGKDLDIVEQTINYSLTPAQAADLAAFDDRLVFNPRVQTLSASSDREEFNYLRLNLADDVAHGRMSPKQARDTYFKTVELEAAGKTSPDLLRLRLIP